MNNEKELVVSKSTVTILPLIILLAGIVELILTYTGCFGGTYTKYSFTPDAIFVVLGIGLIVFAIILFFYMAGCELHITDKRVYGKGAFGKRVDIPIDSISAVGKISWLKGVIVSSSSGSIRFMYLANANEIHSVLSDLIIGRQGKSINNIIKQEIPQSNADELKKFKDLLDSEIITQEEFEAKKKELLGL